MFFSCKFRRDSRQQGNHKKDSSQPAAIAACKKMTNIGIVYWYWDRDKLIWRDQVTISFFSKQLFIDPLLLPEMMPHVHLSKLQPFCGAKKIESRVFHFPGRGGDICAVA